MEPQAILLEPVARNTAPAVAAAALFAQARDPDAVLLVMPSDHVVRDTAGFLEGVARAAEIAAAGRLVLFGIEAHEPHTGYGYIRKGPALNGAGDGFAVDAFFEKPDRAKAERYLGPVAAGRASALPWAPGACYTSPAQDFLRSTPVCCCRRWLVPQQRCSIRVVFLQQMQMHFP